MLFTHNRPSFSCGGFGEQTSFLFQLHFAEVMRRNGDGVQRVYLHDLRRLLGLLRDLYDFLFAYVTDDTKASYVYSSLFWNWSRSHGFHASASRA